MKATDLIAALARNGGVLRLENGQLVFDGPADLLEQNRGAIASLRPQLLELLSSPPCTCEVLDGFRYLCFAHQDTPSGRCLVEPVPEVRHPGLIEKAVSIFGGRSVSQ